MKKAISTKQNPANIARVIAILAGIPGRLETLSRGLEAARIEAPLGPGDRSIHGVLAHIAHCEALTANAITLALVVNAPLLPPVHAERDFGQLVRYDQVPFRELMAYFCTRRAVLLRILESLSPEQWARTVRAEGKARRESVYWLGRSLALHEDEHLTWLAARCANG